MRPIDRACPRKCQPAAGALSPALLQISAEKMSDKRRRKRLGSGDSEGSESESEGTGGGVVGEGKENEEKEGASSDPERDEGVVSFSAVIVYSLTKTSNRPDKQF